MCFLCNPSSYLAALNHANAWFQGTWIWHLCWWAFIHPHELNLKEAKGQVDVQNPLIHTYAACCTYLLMIIHLYIIVYHPYLKHRLYIIDWKPPVINDFPITTRWRNGETLLGFRAGDCCVGGCCRSATHLPRSWCSPVWTSDLGRFPDGRWTSC